MSELAKVFRRRLRAEDVRLFLSHPVLIHILEEVKERTELDLQLRGSYVDVYYGGYNLFQIHCRAKQLHLGSQSDTDFPEFWPKRTMDLDEIDPTNIAPAIAWLQQRRSKPGTDERSFESAIIRDNSAFDALVVVLDRQIVQPGWKKERLDLLLYDTTEQQMVLGEVKLLANKEIAGDFFPQLLRYQGLVANNPSIQATYPHVFEQKATLGVVQHELDALRADKAPLLLLLMSGFDARTTSKGLTERLHTAAKRKSTEYATLDVRVHNWSDFTEAPCRLPAISEMPRFEEWIDSNLNGA